MRLLVSRLLVPSLLLLLAPVADARWSTVDEADYAIDFQNTDYRVARDGTYTMTVEEEITILKEPARQSKGIVQLTYNSRASRLEVLEAATLNGQTRSPVDPALIEDKPLASSSEGFDQNNQVMIVFPEVRVGSRTRLRYRREFKEVPYEGVFSEAFTYGWHELERGGHVHIQSELPLHLEKNDPGSHLKIRQGSPGKSSIVDIDLKKAAFSRPIEEDASFLHPDSVPWVYVSSARDWPTVARSVTPSYREILDAPLPTLFDEIARAARSKPTTEEQLDTVTSMLADRMHYLGDWRPVRGGHIPRTLEKIAATRFGDCKDFAASTAAIVRKLGIEADVAWIYRSRAPMLNSYKLPMDSLFNHAIVRARAGGHDYWLDSTNRESWARGIFEDIADRPALVLRAEKPEMTRTPPVRPDDGLTFMTLKRDLSDPEETRVDARLSLRGRPALSATGLSLESSSDNLKYLMARAVSGGDRLKSWKVADFDLSSRITRDLDFTIHYVESAFELRTSAGRGYLVDPPQSVTTFLANTGNRVSDLLVGSPFRHQREVLLTGIERVGEDSLDCSVDSPWAKISRTATASPEGVLLKDEVELRRSLVSAKEMAEKPFRAFQEKLRACFGSVAVVYRVAAKK